MPINPSPAVTPIQDDRKYFSVDQANRALPYVRRVVTDIVDAYHAAVSLQHKMEFPLPDQDTDQLRGEYDTIMSRLNDLIDELSDVGAELKDYDKGLVDFPAALDGREVSLCWMLGEPEITAWHEVDAGFAGRQPIETLMLHLDEDED